MSLDCWFLLHGFVLFGACITLCFSASDTSSLKGSSRFPIAVVGVSLVCDTFCVCFLGVGSLACSRFSPVPGPWLRKLVALVNGRGELLNERLAKRLDAALSVGTRLAILSRMCRG